MKSALVSDPPDDMALAAYIESSATMLGLAIDPAWQPEVLFHFKAITAAARLIEAFPLPDTLEPAPVYEA